MGPLATQPRPRRVSAVDYLRFERDALEKHEFHDGVIVAMAGGSPEHSLIIANAIATAHARLRGSPCRVYDSNLRVLVARSRRYVYPDASIICGPIEYDPDDEKQQTATNPKVVIEVLFPTTEAYDRGEKFRRYLELPSFQEYVMVSQTAPVVETVCRQPDGSCVLRVYQGMDAVARVQTLGIDLPLSEVFAGVTFPPPAEEPTPPGPIAPPPGT